MVVPRPFLYLLSFHSCCPKCGNVDLKILNERDGVDEMSSNPLSFIQRFLGAPLHWCQFCRLQFYDYRPRRKKFPAVVRKAQAS